MRLTLLLVLPLMLLCSVARADWFLAPESRTLATHRYLPPLLAEGAFITTHFGTRQGITSLRIPDVVTRGRKRDLRATGFTQAFDVGVKLYECVGLFATASGTVKAGLDASSAFELGAVLDAGFQLGGVVRLFRFAQIGSELSVRFAGGLATESELQVKPIVEAAQEANLALLVTPGRNRQLLGSFHFAQTILPSLGLQTAVTLRGTRSTLRPFSASDARRQDETRDDFAVELALALSFDAASFGVPLALMPEYQLTRESLTVRNGAKLELDYRTQRLGAGLYYTGRDDLILGAGVLAALNLEQDRLQWSAADGSRQRSGSPSEVRAHFTFRYVW
ncbi:MAG TPA: hypothetical protein VFX59_00575 [Polyangiales bacterium]|nr:hypothetical protein [Polyangiales bacterium]